MRATAPLIRRNSTRNGGFTAGQAYFCSQAQTFDVDASDVNLRVELFWTPAETAGVSPVPTTASMQLVSPSGAIYDFDDPGPTPDLSVESAPGAITAIIDAPEEGSWTFAARRDATNEPEIQFGWIAFQETTSLVYLAVEVAPDLLPPVYAVNDLLMGK